MTDAADAVLVTPAWDRRARQFVDHSASALLVVGLGLVMLQPQTMQHRLVAIGLALVAASWIAAFLRVPAMHGGRVGPSLAYLGGYVTIATVMIQHDMAFFPFMIGAFFHVYVLDLPWPLTLLCVGTTSVLMYGLTWGGSGVPALSSAEFGLFVVIIVVQTAATTGGVIVGQRTTRLMEERRRTVADLRAAMKENAGLHAQLMVQAREAGVLDERQRLAQEIHDTLAQGLAGIIRQLEAAVRPRDDGEGRRWHIDSALVLARQSLADARRSVQALTPAPLDDARLPDALADVGQRWSSEHGVPAEVTTTGTAERLHPTIEVTLLRVAQEALANVARHARASRAVVTLSYMPDVVTLDVRDDGVGFRPSASTDRDDGRFGLTAMRQRVVGVAGAFAVESEPGEGTSISARVPAVPVVPDGGTGAAAPRVHARRAGGVGA